MPPVSRFPLEKELEKKVVLLFLEGLASAKNRIEAKWFFEAFFTPTEQIMLAKRFAVFFLFEKEIEKEEVASSLNMSMSTVYRLEIWWRNMPDHQRKVVRKVISKRNLAGLFTDILKTFKYGSSIPPKTNWKHWRKEKNKWEKEIKSPIR